MHKSDNDGDTLPHHADHPRAGFAWGLFAAIPLFVACTSAPHPEVVIHASPKGTVRLIEQPDQSFKASHPLSLEPAIVNRVLRGVQVQEQPRLLQTLLAGMPQAVPVFSDDEADFLAPLITIALVKATPQQQIGFQVLHPGPSGTELTGGTLYASGRSLYVTLTHYRHSPARSSADSKPGRHVPDSAELGSRQVLFIPEAARAPEDASERQGLVGVADHATLAIDYGRLTQLPALPAEIEPGSKAAQAANQARPAKPTTANSAIPASEDSSKLEELRALKEYAIKKDMENEALKEEMKVLRQKLADQETELNKLKKRKGKKGKSPSQP